jgi:hypothetical protein
MLKKLVHAELRIIEIRGHAVLSKPAVVRVDRIGAHSLSFLSSLILPVLTQTVYKLQLTLMNESIVLAGSINQRGIEDGNYVYAMRFQLDEPTRIKLVALLSELSRIYMPMHLKADYYYHCFSAPTHPFQKNRVNLCL